MKILKKILKVILIIIAAIVVIVSAALGIFAYTNLHFDELDMKKVWKADFAEKQVITANGSLLNYAEGGSGEVPLLLIHGQGMAWEDYARVLPELSESYRVYAVDCHGHGSSVHDTAVYSCRTMTEDFVWFIENVIGEPCVVSGHSSGGILAANIASTSPENVLGAVLEDPPFFSVLPEEMQDTFVWKDSFEVNHSFINQTEEEYFIPYYYENSYFWKLFQGLEQFPAQTAREYSEKYGKECKKIWYMPYSWTMGLLYTDECDIYFPETFYDGSWFEGVTQEEILSGISCPCIYIKAKTSYGEDGVLYAANTDEDAQKVMSLIPDCSYVETETSDHDIHFKYPDKFINVLTDFQNNIQ